MLREQLLGFAIKTLSQAYETKERIKSNLNSEALQNYIRGMKDTAILVMENQWQRLRKIDQDMGKVESRQGSGKANGQASWQKSTGFIKEVSQKKVRKSSIKPAKDIGSARADVILALLKNDGSRLVSKDDAIDGKTSLAYLIWALGHAHRAQLTEGISVHDVSALLYRACTIELYPINISRVVYGNPTLVTQVGQQKRTKTYLLTPEGEVLFNKNFH